MGGRRRGLGRGLEALFSEAVAESGITEVDLDAIEPNPHQPRRRFGEAELAELADSIREHGLVQPLVVRRLGERYQLVAGERRLRAARMAGLRRVPVVVRNVPEDRLLEVALIENIQRKDLTPLEEARAYEILLRRLGCTQEELAARVGKSRAAVANTIRLLQLDSEVQRLIEDGALTEGHGRALLAVSSPEEQRRLARRVAEERMSVREAEALARRAARNGEEGARRGGSGGKSAGGSGGKAGEGRSPWWQVEEALRVRLAAPVEVRKGTRGGRIEIEFFGEEDLARICDLILGENPSGVMRGAW